MSEPGAESPGLLGAEPLSIQGAGGREIYPDSLRIALNNSYPSLITIVALILIHCNPLNTLQGNIRYMNNS